MSHDSRLESHKCIEPAHQSDTFGNLAHRERHTWQVGFAPERIVADAQHLAERAEQHLLVGVEARQAHTVNTYPAVDGAAPPVVKATSTAAPGASLSSSWRALALPKPPTTSIVGGWFSPAIMTRPTRPVAPATTTRVIRLSLWERPPRQRRVRGAYEISTV